MKVAILGVGAMGKWFAKFAVGNGWDVTVMDKVSSKAETVAGELGAKAVKSEADAVKDADIVIVAVPISKTSAVLTSVSQHMNKGALLMDVASVKGDVVDAMGGLEAELELVSLHPLFGPGATSVDGKDFVAVPVRPGERYAEFKRLLTNLGANVVEMDATEHDQLMAMTQALTHFVLISYVTALRSMRGLKNAEKLKLPMFSSLLDLGKSILAGNADVYGEIQLLNKYARISRSAMLEACRSLDAAFGTGDTKALKQIFDKAQALWKAEEVEEAYRKLYESIEGEV